MVEAARRHKRRKEKQNTFSLNKFSQKRNSFPGVSQEEEREGGLSFPAAVPCGLSEERGEKWLWFFRN